MPPASASSGSRSSTLRAAMRPAGPPFFGILDAVVVGSPSSYAFDGCVERDRALAIWAWIARDVAPDMIDVEGEVDQLARAEALLANLPEILHRARGALATAGGNPESERRLKTQLGGQETWERVPIVLNALKYRTLIEKAQAFGRAANGMTDEPALASALQAMPLADASLAALLMHAMVGSVANPGRLMTAVIRVAGAPTEVSIQRAGFAPLVDAVLAHAQSQLPLLSQMGMFADIDMTCRAIERFHRLIRAVSGYVELSRLSRWATIVAALVKSMSERVEPYLRGVLPDVNKALRRPREGVDRLDHDQLLVALNGVYVLTTVRDCRDSLALNALFDQTWQHVGQTLEVHIQRNLDVLRQNPGDTFSAERMDTAIKMAELRFNPEYADVLRRAKDAAERRLGSTG